MSATDGNGESAIIGREDWAAWLASPGGRYVLSWEQAQYDRTVADLFGYIAVQFGLPELDTLRNSRIASCVHACTRDEYPVLAGAGRTSQLSAVLIEGNDELPFADQTLDLVTLPHVLEFSPDPHHLLREVERVLRPEGRVVLTGFNPVSLWGLRGLLPGGLVKPYLPRDGHRIALPRLRDWFRLLSFEIDRGRYGCYRPPCRTERWLDRTRFMESAGDRWWPICGALYSVSAVKRVRAMRLVGPAWKKKKPARASRAVPVASSPFEPAETRVAAAARRNQDQH